MPNHQVDLDRVFRALTDPTRRAVLERLSEGPRPMTALARPFRMTLPSFSQHLDVLEESGLVESIKVGRTRTYRLTPRPLKTAEQWMERQRSTWASRLDQLDAFLDGMKDSHK